MLDFLPVELRSSLPELYEQEAVQDPMVHVKFFAPGLPQAWFLTEFSQEDQDTCFGYIIDGDQEELGYFSLTFLQDQRVPLVQVVEERKKGKKKTRRTVYKGGQMPLVERDKGFTPKPLSQAKEEYYQQQRD